MISLYSYVQIAEICRDKDNVESRKEVGIEF